MQPTPTLRLFIVMFLSISATNSFSQDTTSFKKLHEVYLSTDYILNPRFSLKYKKSKKGKSIFRIGLSNIVFDNYRKEPEKATSYPYNSFSLSAGIEIGVEKRKKLSKTSTLFFGPALIIRYNYNSSSTLNPNISEENRKHSRYLFESGINCVIGCMVLLNKNCLLAGEISPEIGFKYSKGYDYSSSGDDKTYTLYFNANFYPLTLSFIYRF